MLQIEEYIKELGDYFEGIERYNKALIVKILFPNKWAVYPSEDKRIKPAQSETNPNEYFYYADSDDVKLEEIFQLIIETKNMNESVVNKVQLLKTKIEELKDFFKDKTIEELETLKFVTTKPKKKRKKTTKKIDKKEETNKVNDFVEANDNYKPTINNDEENVINSGNELEISENKAIEQ